MQRATSRARLAVLSAAILAFLMVTLARPSAAQSAEPLNEQKVLALLEGGAPSARVKTIVDERGIAFTYYKNMRIATGTFKIN